MHHGKEEGGGRGKEGDDRRGEGEEGEEEKETCDTWSAHVGPQATGDLDCEASNAHVGPQAEDKQPGDLSCVVCKLGCENWKCVVTLSCFAGLLQIMLLQRVRCCGRCFAGVSVAVVVVVGAVVVVGGCGGTASPRRP